MYFDFKTMNSALYIVYFLSLALEKFQQSVKIEIYKSNKLQRYVHFDFKHLPLPIYFKFIKTKLTLIIIHQKKKINQKSHYTICNTQFIISDQ